ncbi:MAG: 3'(2'),5'-bisphosphate nucleotidase CysQ [Methylotenera sp.]
MRQYHQYLETVIAIAKEAGAAIMQVYATNFDVEHKSDNSPLTQADLAAHHVIVHALKKLTPNIPVLSEESEHVSPAERNGWPIYWLIDPLDGTREFIKRNGEFTVNIALISQHISVLGVVYAPVTELLYYAVAGHGAYKQSKGYAAQPRSIDRLHPRADRRSMRFRRDRVQLHKGQTRTNAGANSLEEFAVRLGIGQIRIGGLPGR